MIYLKSEIIKFISTTLNVEESKIALTTLEADGNMTAKLEDGGSESLINVVAGEKEYVVKTKSNAFGKNVCDAMNYLKEQSFLEKFKKGYAIFYIRDNYNREEKVYKLIEKFSNYLPKIYGATSDSERSLILMEKLNICREVDIEKTANFLREFHSEFNGKKDIAVENGINIHTKLDYSSAKELSLTLLNYVEKAHPSFPKYIIEISKKFVKNFEENFEKIAKYSQTICHGDFTSNNVTFTGNAIKVYDFELATYQNPEFDIISFFVHYPKPITNQTISEFLKLYYNRKPTKKERESLSLNTLIYFTTRFHAMMLICKNVSMPYMETSIKNYISVFDYFLKDF